MARQATDVQMPFLAHLGELRKRIIWTVAAIGVGFVATFAFSEGIVAFLARPLPAKLVALAPVETLWVNIKVSMLAGLFLTLPFVLYQVWAFIAPGLHPHERRFAIPFILVGTALFTIGGAFSLLVVVPFASQFLWTYKTADVITPMWSANFYIGFVVRFTFAFGLAFQLPLAVTLAAKMGLATPQFLAKNRKYAILFCTIAAAILTPTPDAFNLMLMAGPMYFLYEVGIIAARIFGRRSPK